MSKQHSTVIANPWHFFRSGGFDQVRLNRGADLMALDRLDQKLWAALSCPTEGLELDAATLALLDTDHDGRIRPPELIAAMHWAGSLLKDPDDLLAGAPTLPLAAIREDTEEARTVLRSAREILKNLGKPEAKVISAADTADTSRIFAETRFNGDGVVPPESAEDEHTAGVIRDIMACVGSVPDRSGKPGVSAEQVEQFYAQALAHAQWWDRAEADAETLLPLGEATAAAAEAYAAVQAKVEDYYTRCRLAEYDAEAAVHVNPGPPCYEPLSSLALSSASPELASLPIAAVTTGCTLPLRNGINPAWADAVERLQREVAEPVLGATETLSLEQWRDLGARFAAHAAWLAEKQGEMVSPLGVARVRELLADDSQRRIEALIVQDVDLADEADAIASVDRLVRYHRDLYALANNFVAFRDFYTPDRHAIFQCGTLYLDARSCDLCIQVADVAKHSALASLARTYLVYCSCTRRGSGETMTIAAAITDGDAENLRVGRNGVFYDRKGRDWDATVTKIVEHPISVRQAFLEPYKRVGRMVHEQVEKMAAAGEKAMETRAAAGIAEAAKQAESGRPMGPTQPFDVAKFAGIFAAIGLAIGAIGTAIASVVTGFLRLSWWQMPLAVVGLVLVISGPSMVIAYLKLRRRNLAPLLDGNGWAVNTRALINIPFGASLTQVASLPPGAERSLRDPYAHRRTSWKTYAVLLALVIGAGYLWEEGQLQKWWAQLQSHFHVQGAPAGTTGLAKPAS